MDIQTPEWQGNPKSFAEQLFQVIRTALKEQLASSPTEQHVKLIRRASEVFNMKLHSASYGYARHSAGKVVIDDLQDEYAYRFRELEMDV